MCPVYPATDSAADAEAARIADAVYNRWFIDPAVLGEFPREALDLYAKHDILPEMKREDLDVIAGDTVDFIGVNYYFPHYASADATETIFGLNTSGNKDEDCHFSIKGQFKFVKNPKGRYTDWAWEIYPPGLYDLLARAHQYRPGMPIYVTENGIGAQETLNAEGTVDDQYRIDFVREHLEVIHRAIGEGMNVRGYYMWALLDNFSWMNGYKKRYGFFFVDRDTMQRYPKKSAYWYRDVAARNGFSSIDINQEFGDGCTMNDNQQFRAVLWDIDGTLLLSESMHFRALRHAVGTEGKHVPDEFHHEIVGRAASVVYQTARERFGLSMSFDQFRRLKYGYYTEHAHEIEVRPGALEAWRTFAEHGLRQAVVSNSDRIVVNANIRVLGLEEPGFISVSINDVLNGKPHPEPYHRGRSIAGGRAAPMHRRRGQPDRRSGGAMPPVPASSRGRRIWSLSSRRKSRPSTTSGRRSHKVSTEAMNTEGQR